MNCTRRIGAAGLGAIIYLLSGAAWLVLADRIVDLAISMDALSPGGGNLCRDCKAVPLLIVTVALLFIVRLRHLRDMSIGAGRLRLVAEHAANGVAIADESGTLQFANASFLETFGQEHSVEGSASIESLLAPHLVHAGDEPMLPERGEALHMIRLRRGPGHATEIALRARRLPREGDAPGWILTSADLTVEHRDTAANMIQLRALETATDGIAVADLRLADAPVVYVNKAFQRMTGYTEAEMLGRNFRYLQGNDRQQKEITILRGAIERRQPVSVTLRNYRKDGSLFWSEMRLAPVGDAKGEMTHYVAVVRDVTETRATSLALERLAYVDPVTSLPNSMRVTELLTGLLSATTEGVAVIRIDIIRFTEIVSCFGEVVADEILRDVSARLHLAVPGGVIGRVCGNEFVVALDKGDDAALDHAVMAIRAALAPQYAAPGGCVQLFFSIGTAVGTAAMNASTLLRHATIALLQSKRTKIGDVRRFDAEAASEMQQRLRLTSDLQQAVQDNDFVLYYQPKVDLYSGRIIGAEALLRWVHPVFGLQSPGCFIPVAEQTTYIFEIGAWALREAAAFAARINRGRAVPLAISVNVSPIQFEHDGFVEILRQTLRASGIEPSWITLELTESVLTGDTARAVSKLTSIRNMGFGVAIDDFGTGYSSLKYLSIFPVTEIKIDQSFVAGLRDSDYKRTIIQSVVMIGASLDVTVIAEGIESGHDVRELKELGVGQGQGFHFGKPVEEKEFVRWLGEEAPCAVPADNSRPLLVG